MSNDKAPRPDGLPVEFYKSNIEWITEDFIQLYNEAINYSTLGLEINRGVIKLIPKYGDKSLIKNWRLITLLNVSYKILSMMLALRLEILLPLIVSNTQT